MRLLQIRMAQSQGVDSRLWWLPRIQALPKLLTWIYGIEPYLSASLGVAHCSIALSSRFRTRFPSLCRASGSCSLCSSKVFVPETSWQQRCQRQSFAARETQTQSNRRNPNPSPNPRTLPLLHLEDISYARTLTHTQRDCASSMSWPCVCAYLCVYPHAHHGAVECTTPSIPIQISPD